MSDYVDDVGMTVDVDLGDDETPEEALAVTRERIDELEAALELLHEGPYPPDDPQGKVIRLELRVLRQVAEDLEQRVGGPE